MLALKKIDLSNSDSSIFSVLFQLTFIPESSITINDLYKRNIQTISTIANDTYSSPFCTSSLAFLFVIVGVRIIANCMIQKTEKPTDFILLLDEWSITYIYVAFRCLDYITKKKSCHWAALQTISLLLLMCHVCFPDIK